jgi:membrane protein required for colicin V production
MALAAWCFSLLAVHYLHETATYYLATVLPYETGAGVLAFALLSFLPLIAGRFIARRMGRASRGSIIGPIDRLLGFGFGAVKGFIIVVLGFSVVVFAYDIIYGKDGRPDWITQSRNYPFLNAASEELLTAIGNRREEAASQASQVAVHRGRTSSSGE